MAILPKKLDIACGTIVCANWPLENLHHIGAIVHVPTDLVTDVALYANPDTNLLGPFSSTDKNVEPLRVPKTVYLPNPLIGLFLNWDLTIVEAWIRLRVAIINGGLEVDYHPIMDLFRVALTLKTENNKSPLAMPRPTRPMADGDLLCNRHHMITCHLPWLEPSLQRFHG